MRRGIPGSPRSALCRKLDGTDREEPEMPKPQFAVQQACRNFRVPVVEAREERVEETANQNVMKVPRTTK